MIGGLSGCRTAGRAAPRAATYVMQDGSIPMQPGHCEYRELKSETDGRDFFAYDNPRLTSTDG
eukprot:COSAG02_NODE_35160_length_472_cov_8.667560_1_plen_62_part_10